MLSFHLKIKTHGRPGNGFGLNRFVIHTSVHQPLDDKAGFSLDHSVIFGARNLEQAKPWMDYLARSCYPLQQEVRSRCAVRLAKTQTTWSSREARYTGYEFDVFVSAYQCHAG
jgi:hypothetical protein